MLDSERMWIRRQLPALARMPSTRPHPLNPRPPAVPVPPAVAGTAAQGPQAVPSPSSEPSAPSAAPSVDEETDAEDVARAGGFHESSYELQHGLQVSESEWPDDVTVPGALGER
jgi:hypothetical protein